jgi:hypothetical protein
MKCGKEHASLMGKCLEEQELRREERYIETQNNTRKGTARIM